MNFTFLCLAIAAMGVVGAIAHAASEPSSDRVTVVLVHGAFAESSSWDGVIPKLMDKGYDVVAVANPLRSLRTDAAYVATVLDTIKGPVVLVGHSYGGSVITNAAYGRRNVKALVYIDGTAPEQGESTSALSAKFPGGTLGPALAPPLMLPDGNKDLYILRERYHDQFAADVPEADARLMFATQRPVTTAALDEPAAEPAWKSIASYFIYGERDLNIPPASHAFMARRAGAVETIVVKGASHVVMVSHPEEVAGLINRAAVAPWQQAAATVSPATPVTELQNTHLEAFTPAPVVLLDSQPPARLVVDAPLPAQLANGYVVLRYRTENIRLLPVYGPEALRILPRIGHLHITVDDLPWRWLDASGEPVSINALPPGPHKVRIELQDPTHKLIDGKTVSFQIPDRSASRS